LVEDEKDEIVARDKDIISDLENTINGLRKQLEQSKKQY
jgi:hypothetical protein